MPKRAREYDLDWVRPLTRQKTGWQYIDPILQLPLDLVERILSFMHPRQWRPPLSIRPPVEARIPEGVYGLGARVLEHNRVWTRIEYTARSIQRYDVRSGVLGFLARGVGWWNSTPDPFVRYPPAFNREASRRRPLPWHE